MFEIILSVKKLIIPTLPIDTAETGVRHTNTTNRNKMYIDCRIRFTYYIIMVCFRSAQRRIPSGTKGHESGSGADGAHGVQPAERSSGPDGRLEERQRRRAHRFDDKVRTLHNIITIICYTYRKAFPSHFSIRLIYAYLTSSIFSVYYVVLYFCTYVLKSIAIKRRMRNTYIIL